MTYRPLRKDFSFHCCARCRRKFPTNTAVFIQDDDGGIEPYGPDCAETVLGGAVGPVADLTLAQIGEELRGRRVAKGHPDYERIQAEDRTRRALTYLLLREERLAEHFRGASYPPLLEIYERFNLDGQLSDEEVARVLNTEAYNAAKHPQFSLQNLLAVYAFHTMISRAIRQLPADKAGFLIDMQTKLERDLRLSSKQAGSVNKWLERLKELHQIDPAGFAWSWDHAAADLDAHG